MKKKVFQNKDINLTRKKLLQVYINKYFNLFMNSIEFTNLDYNQQDYIMRKFWSEGTVAAFPIKNTGELGFTLYATQQYNMYDMPEVVQLINKWNVPFMPITPQVVDKDVVIGWAQSNHKPVETIVRSYIDRMVQVDMVINTNLNVHKMPFLVGVTPTDEDKIQDLINRILNDELAVFTDLEDLSMVQAFVTQTPYIIDKLYAYRTSLENELLTYLGLDNNLDDPTKDRLLVDQVNANNNLINANQYGFKKNIEAFIDHIREVLGYEITMEFVYKPVDSVYDNKEGGPDNDLQ